MLHHLDVPEELNRNAPNIAALGVENTGQQLIELAMHQTGRVTLANVDVLDVGCGVRFTQAIINRAIPIGSYTGIEVYRPIVDFFPEKPQCRQPPIPFNDHEGIGLPIDCSDNDSIHGQEAISKDAIS